MAKVILQISARMYKKTTRSKLGQNVTANPMYQVTKKGREIKLMA